MIFKKEDVFSLKTRANKTSYTLLSPPRLRATCHFRNRDKHGDISGYNCEIDYIEPDTGIELYVGWFEINYRGVLKTSIFLDALNNAMTGSLKYKLIQAIYNE